MMRMRSAKWTWVLGILAACSASGSAGDDDHADATEDSGGSGDDGGTAGTGTADDGGTTEAMGDPAVVYWRDVKPIVDARCTACHNPDGVAPFSLTTYADAAAYAASIGAAVSSGMMPPWPASSDCNDYMFDPSLDDAQIETLTTWADLGAPEGDPADEGEALPVIGASLPRVDFDVAMTEAHAPTPPTGEVDEHRCFLLDWPQSATSYVTGYEVVPGNRKVVHHLVAKIVSPAGVADLETEDATDDAYGWPCGAGTGMSGGGGPLLGVWVPGQGATLFPDGTGLEVEAGSKVLLNMHYNVLMGDTSPDQTSIHFMVEDAVDKVGQAQFVTDPTWPIGDNMLIAAGDDDSVYAFDFAVPLVDVTVYNVGLHMHVLGHYASLVVEHDDGNEECAIDIPQWDFNWQLGYRLESPLVVNAGERVRLTCGFDNSAANQPIVDGMARTPADVTWGEDTYDEMCLGYVYVTRN